jgi:HAD superfamily hydrolase (TIGR01450 family)
MLAEHFDVFLFDLDGVIYVGDRALPRAREALGRLRGMGKRVRFLTNDPRPTRAQIVERLTVMGIAVAIDEVVTSGWATGRYLHQHDLSSAYVVGSAGLGWEISQAGIAVVAHGRPDVVVIGCDERVSYQDIRQAATFIDRGAQFVATNDDGSFPTPAGRAPATGAIMAAVQAVTDSRPVIIGKPAPAMFLAALEGTEEHPRAVMVGDSPVTDILGAHQVGLAAILVSPERVRFPSTRDARAPDAHIPDLSALFDPDLRACRLTKASFVWPERVAAGVAAVVLADDQRVLLVQRADIGLWGLPSGRVEPGETVAEAVVREVREETGLDVAVERLIGVYSDPASQVFAYPSGPVVQFVTSCFACRVIGGIARADGIEALDVAFFAPHDLPADLLPMHPRWLTDALEGKLAAHIR